MAENLWRLAGHFIPENLRLSLDIWGNCPAKGPWPPPLNPPLNLRLNGNGVVFSSFYF